MHRVRDGRQRWQVHVSGMLDDTRRDVHCLRRELRNVLVGIGDVRHVLSGLQVYHGVSQYLHAVRRGDLLCGRNAGLVHALRSRAHERRQLLQQRRLQLVRNGLLELLNNYNGLRPVRRWLQKYWQWHFDVHSVRAGHLCGLSQYGHSLRGHVLRWLHDAGHRGLHLSVLLQRGLLNRLHDLHVSERSRLLCVHDGLLSSLWHGLLSMRQQLHGVLGRGLIGLHSVRGEQVPFVRSVQVVPNWLHQQRRHCDYLHCVRGLLVRPRQQHRYLRLHCRLRSDHIGPHGLRLHAVHLQQVDGRDRCRHVVVLQLVQGGLRCLRRDQWVHSVLWRLLGGRGNLVHSVQHGLHDVRVWRPLYLAQRLQHVRGRLHRWRDYCEYCGLRYLRLRLRLDGRGVRLDNIVFGLRFRLQQQWHSNTCSDLRPVRSGLLFYFGRQCKQTVSYVHAVRWHGRCRRYRGNRQRLLFVRRWLRLLLWKLVHAVRRWILLRWGRYRGHDQHGLLVLSCGLHERRRRSISVGLHNVRRRLHWNSPSDHRQWCHHS